MLKVSDIRTRLYKTALRSPCRYRIAAIALDERGNAIATATNVPRYPKHGGGIHAEMRALAKCKGRKVSEIWIIRIGNAGDERPIRACKRCEAVAAKHGIRIRSFREE